MMITMKFHKIINREKKSKSVQFNIIQKINRLRQRQHYNHFILRRVGVCSINAIDIYPQFAMGGIRSSASSDLY